MNKVSVIIPAYNKADYTALAIDSVLGQTYPDIEIIVVDDGSTDKTRERLAAYGQKIRYIYKENGGACSARNIGIREARGEYIALLDCDDLYAANKIELGVEYFQRHPGIGFIHTAAHFIDREGRTVGYYSHPKSRRQGSIAGQLILGNHICNSTVMVRRSCFEKVGLFDESIFTPADWDMWLRLAEHFQAGYINMPLTRYRVSDNYILNKLDLARQEEEKVVENYFKRHPQASAIERRRVLSFLHLRFAECYLIKDNPLRLKEEFKTAVDLYPWNLKTWALLVLYGCARPLLRNVLTKKILRNGSK